MDRVTLAAYVAVGLYLLPVVLVMLPNKNDPVALGCRAAARISTALAVDLLVILSLSWLVRLDYAALFSRVGWLGYGAWKILLGRTRWPKIGVSTLKYLIAAAATALFLSVIISRPCAIWDRQWHIPLVTTMRGQTLPFANVYEPWGRLAYHFSGNVVAATISALSFGILHSSYALSLAHDVFFVLTGLSIALLAREFGLKSPVLAALLTAAVLLAGPLTNFRGESYRPTTGYSIVSYLSLSFRPHVSLAGVLVIGYISALFGSKKTALPSGMSLAAISAAFVLTDESTLALLGLATGATWLWAPQVLARTRAQGLLILLAMLGALVFAVLAYGGSFGAGAPTYDFRWTAPRAPGYYQPQQFGWSALSLMLQDLGPILLIGLAGLALCFKKGRETVRLQLAFLVTLCVPAFILFACLQYNASGLENHRFITAPLLLAPLFAGLWLSSGVTDHKSVQGAMLLAAMVAPGFSSIEWASGGQAYSDCHGYQGILGKEFFYATDCRSEMSASLGEKTRPVYAEANLWYLYSGCRPSFTEGPAGFTGHGIKVGGARDGVPALRALEKDFGIGQGDLTAICAPRSADVVCAFALKHSVCSRIGARALSCQLTQEQRATLLGT